MKNKRGQVSVLGIIFMIVAVVILLLGVGIYAYFAKGSAQAVVQASTTGSFQCPSNKLCSVTPSLVCTTPQENTKVVFRTNALSYDDYAKTSGIWIAINCVPNKDTCVQTSDLHGYCLTSDRNSVLPTPFMATPTANKVYVHNGFILVEYLRPGLGTSYHQLDPNCPSADTTITSIPSYANNHQEITSGSTFSCDKSVSINNVVKDHITYSGIVATDSNGIVGKTYSLNGGDTISTDGTGTALLNYKISDILSTTCIDSNGNVINQGSSYCLNKQTLETCNAQTNANPTLSTIYAVSPQVCVNGKISNGYNANINLSGPIISSSQNLDIDVVLTGDAITNVPVTVQILNANNNQQVKYLTQDTGNNPVNLGKTHFSFSGLSSGYYTIRISFSHIDGDFTKDYSIQVTNSVGVVMQSPDLNQFDSNPITVQIVSTQGGQPYPLKDFKLTTTYNNQVVYYDSCSELSTGIKTCIFNIGHLKGPGELLASATGQDNFGVWTPQSSTIDIHVSKSMILIAPNFINDKCTGTYTNYFTTKDSAGNLIDTQNQIEIDHPQDTGKDNPTISGNAGNYSFSYAFTQGGLYVIKITSTSSSIGTSQLNGGSGSTINILTGGSCNNPTPTCQENGTCPIDWTWYLIIGGFVLAIGVFVYFVFFFRRKK